MDPYRITRKAVECEPIVHKDPQREDGKMTSEDSHMIGTDLLVYRDDDDDVQKPVEFRKATRLRMG
jgi:hypothetical protein